MKDSNFNIESLFRLDESLQPSPELKEKVLKKAAKMTNTPVCTKSKAPILSFRRQVAVIAASVLLFCAVFIGIFAANSAEYGSVYIDVNPSVELILSKNERVRGVVYHNRDAQKLFSKLHLEGKDVTDAMNEIFTVLEENEILTDESEIYISASAKRERNAEKILNHSLTGATEYLKYIGCGAVLNSNFITLEDIINAEGKGISPSKFKVVQEIKDIDESYTLDLLKDLDMKSLKNIYELLSAYE